MKKLYLYLLLLSSGSLNLVYAQANIPDKDFENWTRHTSGRYEAPSSDWWASLNRLSLLGAPATVSKTTDAHSGSHAVKLETKSYGTLLIPGILVAGHYDASAAPTFLAQGQAFSGFWDRFQGWFKYYPVHHDSAVIVARLKHYNATTGRSEIVAEAAQYFYDSVATYTQFDIPFVYQKPGLGIDTVEIVLLASGGGERLEGQVGSTLYVDDIDFSPLQTSVQNPQSETALHLFPQPAHDFLKLDLPRTAFPATAHVYDLQGRLIQTTSLKNPSEGIRLTQLNPGTYLLRLTTAKAQTLSKTFLHN